MYINNVEFSACRTTHTPQQHNTAQHSNTAQPFTRVCLEFLTTLTCRALYGKSHCHGQSCRFLALVFNHFDFQNTARESHCVSTFETIEKTKKCVFSILCVSPGHLETIQNLIPGWTTNVELLKQVKNWQSPSRDPWSNCLINSREDDKGQTKYYSGRQKDNSKTICGPPGYLQLTCNALRQLHTISQPQYRLRGNDCRCKQPCRYKKQQKMLMST